MLSKKIPTLLLFLLPAVAGAADAPAPPVAGPAPVATADVASGTSAPSATAPASSATAATANTAETAAGGSTTAASPVPPAAPSAAGAADAAPGTGNKPTSAATPPFPLEHPVVFFTLPTHGALGDLMDRGAIKLGTSGHIGNARNMLMSMPRSPVPMALSCADINARMAVEKALKSVTDGALKGGVLLLMEGSKCPATFVVDAQRAGIETRLSDSVFPFKALQSGPR